MKGRCFISLLYIVSLYSCKRQHNPVPPVISADYEKGDALLNKKNDSAFYYFNKVVISSKNSREIAVAYNKMAIIQSEAGDYFGSQESLLTSLKYLDKRKRKDDDCLLADYNELGNISLNLKNYDAAIDYYDQALQFAKDDNFKRITLNNKAVTYQKKQQYEQALAIYHSIIDSAKDDKREYARTLSNMARTKWLEDAHYNAAPELWEALQIRKSEKDNWGLNASYAHLSDYYFKKHPDSALFYAGKMYVVAQQLGSPDDELEALQKLIPLSPPQMVKRYFTRYHYLSDSLQTGRNNAKNQFALIRYEAAKNKADNLALQKDNAEKKVQIILQRAVLLGVIIFTALMLFGYRKRKQQAIHRQQLQISQKVHDVVANGLYRIMTKIEHGPQIEKEQLLDDMEVLYEQSRDISYESAQKSKLSFPEQIATLLKSFSSEKISISIVGNTSGFWDRVTVKTQAEVKHILQELMINMKKHSTAENVVVRFDEAENSIHIRYTDDGIGMPASVQFGNGLTSTENRIKSSGGEIIFDRSAVKGLKIQVFIPIS